MTQGTPPTTAPEPTTDAPRPTPPADDAANLVHPAANLSLTDFLDIATLQEIQDSFTAVTRLATSIHDRQGNRVTQPTDAASQAERDRVLNFLIEPEGLDTDQPLEAPITVEGQSLGTIRVAAQLSSDDIASHDCDHTALRDTARNLGVAEHDIDALVRAAIDCCGPNRAAGVQFLYLLANSIARLCYQEYQLRQRVEELTTLYNVSTMLARHRDREQILDAAARSAREVMKVKAVSIRLLQGDQLELAPVAVCNLSREYLNKGAILLSHAPIFQKAMEGEPVYVQDMRHDDRIVYPEDAQREGLVSMLVVPMVYQDQPIGAIQLYTGEPRQFSRFDIKLIQAMAQLLATAIENARLDEQRSDSMRVQRQLRLAGDVQKRMLPSRIPTVRNLDIAARYVPSFELGGDFYDFIDLEGNIGVGIGDVVGKGVAASLLMASVRASLRAYAQDVYDIDEIISRVNTALVRDTLDKEFATLWYGVFDPQTRRLTYCNAGHEPVLLCREGRISTMGVGGMLVGVDELQTYDKGIVHLLPGDMILLYTDGLPDSFNAQGQRFGRQRTIEALQSAATLSAHDAINHILWQRRRFVELQRGSDDTTIVVLKVT